ncbi:MAG: TIGR03936 family radical SAM-associated protein [Christensenellales bacterium]|jgi:radical SAM-linked protein|nr:DUF2344 domain-containing protein [Clostridiales bacterium]
MLSFKFRKALNAVYLSHIDILKTINKTLRRTHIPIDYSRGFNPHMLINMSQPLSLGIESLAEWATVQTSYDDPQGFLELYNNCCPQGLEASQCHITQTKPNIAGKVIASDYFIKNDKAVEIKEILENINKKPFFMEVKSKSGVYEKDVSPLIYRIKADADGIYLLSAFGNTNLRCDRFTEKLNQAFNLDIKLRDVTRLNQYVDQNGELKEVGEYIKGLL